MSGSIDDTISFLTPMSLPLSSFTPTAFLSLLSTMLDTPEPVSMCPPFASRNRDNASGRLIIPPFTTLFPSS